MVIVCTWPVTVVTMVTGVGVHDDVDFDEEVVVVDVDDVVDEEDVEDVDYTPRLSVMSSKASAHTLVQFLKHDASIRRNAYSQRRRRVGRG